MTSIGVVGSREFTDYEMLKSVLDEFEFKELITGGAIGTDTLAMRYADEKHIPKKVFYPDWKTYGKSAGPIRNRLIVENSDYLIYFWNGTSPGTKITMDIAKELNKPYKIIFVE